MHASSKAADERKRANLFGRELVYGAVTTELDRKHRFPPFCSRRAGIGR